MFLAMAGGSKMSKTRIRPPTIFTFRLLTLALAAAVFVLESYREPGSILKGHRRRQAMQYDQFPTTPEPWTCDVLARSHSSPSAALFLEALACGWDGSHYAFIGDHGYRPNSLIYDAVFSEPGPLGLHFNISQGRHAEVDAFLVKGGELMQAQAGRRVHIGDHLLAINGHPVAVSDMTQAGIASMFRRHGSVPYTLTFLSDPMRELTAKESAFSPLVPYLMLRPMARSRLVTPVHHACLLLMATFLSALALFVCRLTAVAMGRAPCGEPPSSRGIWVNEVLLLGLPGAFSLCLPYSEALYFLLSATLLYGLASRRLWVAGLASFLLPLCRPLGVFTALPLITYTIAARATSSQKQMRLLASDFMWLWPIFGFCGHLVLQGAIHGDVLSSMSSQSSFIAGFSLRKLLWPSHLIPEFLYGRGDRGLSWHVDPLNSLLDRAHFVAAIFLLSVTFGCLPLHVWLYSLVHLLVPPLSGSFMSYTRFFVIGSFPLLLWGLRISDEKARKEPVALQQAVIERGSQSTGGVTGVRPPPSYSPSFVYIVAGVCVGIQADMMRRFMTAQWAF